VPDAVVHVEHARTNEHTEEKSMQRSLIALAAATLSLQALAAAPASYTIVDLGADQQPLDANAKGTIVGYTISTHTPVTYADGVWTPLPLQGTQGEARAINFHGVIAGFDAQIVEWKRNGQRERLAGTHTGKAEGIADDGTIVGSDFRGSHFSCFKWKDGVIIPIIGPGDDCLTHAISPNGAFIGGESNDDGFIQDSTGLHDIGTLVPGGFSTTVKVNKHGHAAVLSTYDDSNQWAAVYWNGKRLVDIGLHPNESQSVSTAINEHDDVLVGGQDDAGHTLFLYSARGPVVTPIEPLIVNPAGWVFDVDPTLELAALTDDGTIYGAAHLDGVMHAFKLVPGAAD
jgi:hypothetical protein